MEDNVVDLTSSPHAQTGPGDEQPQQACSVLLLSDSEDDQQPDHRAVATKAVSESGKGDRPASLGSPDDVLLKPLTISSQPSNGHGPGAVRSGRPPLGVSTLAENAAPQKLGDVGGHCAASGFPDRIPADAASQQQGAAADDEWQQEESDEERPGETAKQRAARKKREEAAVRKRQREAVREEKRQHREEEKRQKVAEKDHNREAKGTDCLQRVVAVFGTTLALHPAAQAAMTRLQDQRTVSGFTCPHGIRRQIQQLPLDTAARGDLPALKSLCWRRLVGAIPAQDAPLVQANLEDFPYVLLLFEAAHFVAEVQADYLQSALQAVVAAHPGCTLSLVVQGLSAYLRQQTAAGFREDIRAGRTAQAAFSRASIDEFMGDLAVRWPGVTHRVTLDAHQTAEHLLYTTMALAKQPSTDQQHFLRDFGGQSTSESMLKVLRTNPLEQRERRTLFHALNKVPHLGPPSAWAITERFGSLGGLMTSFTDPSRSESDKKALVAALTQPTGQQRRVGPATAQKLFTILTSTDPDAVVEA